MKMEGEMDPIIITYVLLGLVSLLLIGLIVLLVSVIKLRNSVKKNTRKTTQTAEYMQQSIRQDIQNVQDNVRGLQTTMAQTMTQSYASLNQTLDNKLQGSFDSINSYLQDMNKDLGEMKSVASGIEDVKKVLTNVKSRGILGEIQLGSILEEILSPDQYETDVATIPGSRDRVEYAVKMPGSGEGTVYLPIDAKSPLDTYAALQNAYESGSREAVESASAQLSRAVRGFARDNQGIPGLAAVNGHVKRKVVPALRIDGRSGRYDLHFIGDRLDRCVHRVLRRVQFQFYKAVAEVRGAQSGDPLDQFFRYQFGKRLIIVFHISCSYSKILM